MTPTGQFELVLAFMAAAVLLELAARRLHMPPAAALVIGGIVLALIPRIPDFELDPDLVLVLFLPPLLMASAFFTVWRDFRGDLRTILELAVGVVAHAMTPGLPFSQAADTLAPKRREHFGVVLDAAARAELLRLHDAREIHDDVLRVLEQELDLEEVAARRHLD